MADNENEGAAVEAGIEDGASRLASKASIPAVLGPSFQLDFPQRPPRELRKAPKPMLLPEMPMFHKPLAELSFTKLSTSIDWLMNAVKELQGGGEDVADHLDRSHTLEAEVGVRLVKLEEFAAKPAPTIEKAPPPPPPPPELKIDDEFAEKLALLGFVRKPEVDTAIAASNLGWVKQEDIDGAVGKLDESLRGKMSETIKEEIERSRKGIVLKVDYQREMSVLRDEITEKVLTVDFEPHKEAVIAQLAELDAAHKENVDIRAQQQERLKDLSHKMEVVESRASKEDEVLGRLDCCENLTNDLNKRVISFEERVDAHDQKFDKMEELRQRMSKDKGPVTLQSLASADIESEVRRLRSMVECMEQAMGDDLRKTMDFFRESERQEQVEKLKNSPARPTPGSTHIPGKARQDAEAQERLTAIQDEMEARMQQCQAKMEREQNNTFTALKVIQRDSAQLDAKVEDMWSRLPKIAAFLEPIKANSEAIADAASSDAAAGAAVETAKLGARAEMQALTDMMRQSLKTIVGDVRSSVDQSIREVRDDVQRKANANELASLSDRLDAWTQSAPAFTQKSRRKQKADEEEQVDPDRAITEDAEAVDSGSAAEPPKRTASKQIMFQAPSVATRPKATTCHDGSCKQPTNPTMAKMSQSLGRLPKA